MDNLNDLTLRRAPTRHRPLLGLTVLVVEDSCFACEAIRLMCLRSGARLRRADCLRSARRHLKVYRPSTVLIDLGLPDGSGLDLITELSHAAPRVGVILGLSGDTDKAAHACAAGADGFLAKPLDSLASFQAAILEHLPPEHRPSGPRSVQNEAINPDTLALHEDMHHVVTLLDDHNDGPVLDYVAQFLNGVARAADDIPLVEAAKDLARARASGHVSRQKVTQLIGMVRERLESRVAI